MCGASFSKSTVSRLVGSQGALVAKSVREDGLRELLAVEVADTESDVAQERLAGELDTIRPWIAA